MNKDEIFTSNDGRKYRLEKIHHNATLLNKTRELANEIGNCVKNNPEINTITLVIVMEGATYFGGDLVNFFPRNSFNVDIELIYVHKKTENDPEIRFRDFKFGETLNKKYVVIADDIARTGKTLAAIKERIETMFPSIKALKTVTLLKNKDVSTSPDYYGIELDGSFSKNFVVGHGLDFEGRHRGEVNLYKVNFID